VLTGTACGEVVYWRHAEGRFLERWRAKHDGRVIGTAAGGGGILVSGALDGTLRAWDGETGKPRFTIPGHKAWFGSVCMQDDRGVMITDGRDNAVYMYDFSISEDDDRFR